MKVTTLFCLGATALVGTFLFPACASDDGGAGDEGGEGPGPGPGTGGTDTAPREPCEAETCSGHGTCQANGEAESCRCDEGFTEAEGLRCVVQCDERPTSCFGSAGTPADGAITVSLVASRDSGVGPLSVFFDASGTTAMATDRPYHDLAYCWTFGDGDSGCYGPTGASKDQARGPVAAHVFETPGTYTVTLTVRDMGGLEETASVDITVTDPEEAFADSTVCLATDEDFTGCPDGAEQLTGEDLSLLQDAMGSGARRLLMKRGQTFTVAGNGGLAITEAGPGWLGAFGEGLPPVINPEKFAISVHDVAGNNAGNDWRVVDVDVDGLGLEGSAGVDTGTQPDGERTDFLMLRTRVYGTGRGVYPAGIGFTLQDCEVRDIVGGSGANIVFARAQQMALLGSRFWNSTGAEHVLRLAEVQGVVVSGNELGEAPESRQVIKLHGPETDGMFTGEYTERVLISENLIRGSGGHGWTIAVGAQNGSADERLRNVLIDGNMIITEPPVAVPLVQRGEDVTVRNNIFLASGNPPQQFIWIERIGIEQPPRRVHILNNTAVATSNERRARLMRIHPEGEDLVVGNNLIVGPEEALVTATDPEESGEANTTFIGNVAATGEGIFSVEPPTEWSDFRPAADGPAPGAGSTDAASIWDYYWGTRISPPTAGALDP